MASINFSGIGSNIDFGAITDSIIAQGQRPISQLQSRKSTLTQRIDSLKKLNAGLITLKEAATALTDQTLGSGRIASSSDSAAMTATASTSAVSGTVNVSITRLASSLSQASRSYATSLTEVLANGATTATFELRKGGSPTASATITIDSTNNTLSGLRDAINNANAGVTATIVDVTGDGTGNQLVLNSTDTGQVGRVELVETTATGSLADINFRNLNPPGAISDLDASLTINGLAITRSTNSISDAVTGLTLNLKKSGSSASVTVSQNSGVINEKLQVFIDSYNSIQDAIASQYKVDTNGRPTGLLAGDPTLREVQTQLREALSAVSTTNGGGFSNLTQIGLGRDNTGKLTLDSTVLSNALKNNLSDVQALLFGKTSNDKGLANSITDVANGLSDSISGVVQSAINGHNSSISNIEQSITQQQTRLTLLRATLSRQFSAADAAIGQLNGQGSSLTSILNAFNSSKSR